MDIAFGPYGLTAKADASGVDLKVYVKDISCLEFSVIPSEERDLAESHEKNIHGHFWFDLCSFMLKINTQIAMSSERDRVT